MELKRKMLIMNHLQGNLQYTDPLGVSQCPLLPYTLINEIPSKLYIEYRESINLRNYEKRKITQTNKT